MDVTRTPVIVGVGQVNDRLNLLDPVDLMAEAVSRADIDSGGGWIAAVQSLAVVAQISFPEIGDASAVLAERLQLPRRVATQTPYPTGESPLQLLHEAANRVGTGEIEVALIVGAEALRTAAERRSGDRLRAVATKGAAKGLARYGLIAPTDIYPLYENAMRAAQGQTLAEAQAESADMWSAMSRVAAANPDAWLQRELSAQEVVTVAADNRMIAFPYTKLMVANAAVNMGAGFIVTSLARARAAGVPDAKLVHIGASAAAHEPHSILKRDRYDRSASMVATLEGVMERNALTIDQVDHAELYSCFPCIPKLARRTIRWPDAQTVTVFGGLTFGGGPIGNYMGHAVAAMVQRLRANGGRSLLYANGGYATHNFATVLSAEMTGIAFPHDADVNSACARGSVPSVVERWDGPARIETYTAFYNRDGSVRSGTVIARTPEGARVVASVEDAAVLAWLTDGVDEPVGVMGTAMTDAEGLVRWVR